MPDDHPLANAGTAPLERFASDTFIDVPPAAAPRWHASLHALFARHGIAPPLGQAVSSAVAHLWMVQQRQGVTLVPEQIAARSSDGISFVEIEGEFRIPGVAWRSDRPPGELGELLAAARRAAAALGIAPPP